MPELKRVVGFRELLFYSIGVILGAGIYALIGPAAGVAGNAVWLAFGIGAVIALFTALSYAELASTMPECAAEYHYVQSAFKRKPLSFIVEWLLIIVGTTSAATVALGFSGYFNKLFGTLGYTLFATPIVSITSMTLVAILLIIVLSYLNYRSMEESAKLNIIFTLIEASGLMIIIALGAMFIGQGHPIPDLLKTPAGISGIMGGMIMVFFAYLGFEEIANIGEEVKNPTKNIPKALVLSVLITTVIYILVSVCAITVVPAEQLASNPAPLATVATTVIGPNGGVLLSIIALFATANTILIILIATSRIIYGVAKQGVLPKKLSKVSSKTNTPLFAIILTCASATVFTLFNNIGDLAEMTNFGLFLVFFFVNLSLIKLRYSKNRVCSKFRTPINIGKFPVLSALGAASCLIAMLSYLVKYNNGWIIEPLNTSFITSLLIILIGIFVYILLNKRNIARNK